MTSVEHVKRPEVHFNGTEEEVLWSMLEHYRATALDKCADLNDEQLRRQSVPPSSLSMIGIVRHLTDVERYWFQECFLGLDVDSRYSTDEDRDADFHATDSAPTDEVVAAFLSECEASRAVTRSHRLDESAQKLRRGIDVTLRFIGVHLVEEYARHCGHLDLLREAIDGEVDHG
jgi:uncharacterized damage-inducible protein DinB